jgi:hypothetical protein
MKCCPIHNRPILFSAPMVQALLAGKKTQTRRVVKPQPTHCPERRMTFDQPNGIGTAEIPADYWRMGKGKLARVDCPFGNVGDGLWVRETWCVGYPGTRDPILYRASYEGGAEHTWKPSIHMLRMDSRILLEITDIRVERVQDISEKECLAEGTAALTYRSASAGIEVHFTPKQNFGSLWDSIYGNRQGCSWQANPWVWAITFKMVEVNIF